MNAFEEKVLDKRAKTLGFNDWEEFKVACEDDWQEDKCEDAEALLALARQEMLEKIEKEDMAHKPCILFSVDYKQGWQDCLKQQRSFLQGEEK